MNAIKNITVGHTERLCKPVGFTMLANLVNIVPFCLSIEAVNVIFRACDGSGTPLDTARLWTIFGILAIYMAAMALAERAAYRANFRGAYEMSAEGRISWPSTCASSRSDSCRAATRATCRRCSSPISRWPRRASHTICRS